MKQQAIKVLVRLPQDMKTWLAHGRVQVEQPKVYTIVQQMPVEADGRLRYRIKSEKIERVVTEDQLSYCQ
jgi:hypothetical protein